MTDKKIVVDGIDISECEHACINTSLFKEKTLVQCSAFFLENEDSCCDCSDNPSCYYKQLKRKEQECEELKKANDEKNELLAKLGCPTTATAKMKAHCLQEQLDQLKAENEQLKSVRDSWMSKCEQETKIREFCQNGLNQLKEELEAERNWHKTADEISKANSEYTTKLKQAFAEIKKIAEILVPMTDEYENCYDRDRCFECDFTEDCSYFNIKRILQICDEVIDE